MPQLSLEEDSYLEVIYELKLVGLVISSDNTWTAHVNYTVARVNRVLWQLTRFRRLGAPEDKLVTFLYIEDQINTHVWSDVFSLSIIKGIEPQT